MKIWDTKLSAGPGGPFEYPSNTEVSEKHRCAYMDLVIAVYTIYVGNGTPEIADSPGQKSGGGGSCHAHPTPHFGGRVGQKKY